MADESGFDPFASPAGAGGGFDPFGAPPAATGGGFDVFGAPPAATDGGGFDLFGGAAPAQPQVDIPLPVAQAEDAGDDVDGPAFKARKGDDEPPSRLEIIALGGTFVTKLGGDVTRQQLIEFTNMLRWTSESCMATPLAVTLWLTLVTIILVQSHYQASFAVGNALEQHIQNLTADNTRGVAPARVYSESLDSGSKCTCSCSLLGLSTTCSATPPGTGVFRYTGDVTPSNLQLMRTRAGRVAIMQDIQAQMAEPTPMQLADLQTIPDVWYWVQRGFVPELWGEQRSDLPVDLTMVLGLAPTLEASSPGTVLNFNQVIGGLRMRTFRLQPADCRADERITSNFDHTCHSEELSGEAYGPGIDSYAEGFIASSTTDHYFDVYMDVERPIFMALETIEFMLIPYDWLDRASKALELHAMFMNAEMSPPLFGVMKVRFDFERSGELKTSVEVKTTATNLYPSFFPTVFLDLAWCMLIVALLIRQVRRVVKMPKRKRRRRRLDDEEEEDEEDEEQEPEPEEPVRPFGIWDVLDWVSIIGGFGIFVHWLLIVQETNIVNRDIGDLPPAPEFGAQPSLITTYHELWGEVLDKLQSLLELRGNHRLATFWYTLLLFFHFFRILRGQPRLAQLATTLYEAVKDIVHFLLLFLVLFLHFAFSGFMIYGLDLEEWSTPAGSVIATFRSFTGYTDLTTMYDVAPVSTVAWFMLFASSVIFLVLNLLLAMIFDHHATFKSQSGKVTGLFAQLRFFAKDMARRTTLRDVMTCCKHRRDGFPSHERILQEALKQSKLTDTEKRIVRSSLLGMKLQRQLREKLLFTSQDDSDVVRMLREPARRDMDRAEADDDYIDAYLDDCAEHALGEINMEDAKTNQLRELVALAELDMVNMRERLAETEHNVQGSMAHLVEHLQDIETLVHTSLQELVLVAETAGVPGKVKEKKEDEFRPNMSTAITKLGTRNDPKLSAAMTKVVRQFQAADTGPRQKESVAKWHASRKNIELRSLANRYSASAAGEVSEFRRKGLEKK